MIERNRHIAGRRANMLFGLANVVDGLVRVLSLGFCHTCLPLEVSRRSMKKVAKTQGLKK